MSDYKSRPLPVAAAKEILLARAAIERAEYASFLSAAHSAGTSWNDIVAYGSLLLRVSQFFRASSMLCKLSRVVRAVKFLTNFVTKFRI